MVDGILSRLGHRPRKMPAVPVFRRAEAKLRFEPGAVLQCIVPCAHNPLPVLGMNGVLPGASQSSFDPQPCGFAPSRAYVIQ